MRQLRLPPAAVEALEKLDLRDLHIYGGLALVGVGLAPLLGAYTPAAVGAVLFYLGVWRMK